MIPNLPAYVLGAALLASLIFGGVQCSQKQDARRELAEDRAKAAEEIARFEAEARQMERRHAADMNRIEIEARSRVEEAGSAAYDRAIADVRAGRLRNVWSCPAAPKVPGAVGPSPVSDGEAADREEAVARVLRIGAEADAKLAACQAVIRSDREMLR